MKVTLLGVSAFRLRCSYLLVAMLWLTGCADDGPQQPMILGGVTIQPDVLKRGRAVFLQNCARCHGMKGDGRTTAMRGPHPPPDLRLGEYKYNSVVQGGLPLDRDLLETTRKGLGGGRMPAHEFLPESDLNAVVQFTKSLAPRWSKEPTGTPVKIPANPWSAEQRNEASARGEFVYHVTARCWTCHPAYSEPRDSDPSQTMNTPTPAPLRANPSQPVPMVTSSGTVMPPDFRDPQLALGCDMERQVQSVAAGITSMGMPAWHEVMTGRDLWAIGHYLQSLCANPNHKLRDQVLPPH